jgi:carbon starvation protein
LWEHLLWAISPSTGEQINALWIVVASVCIYLIAYRFYGRYIAKNVLAVDATRMTPAVRHNDGLDYVPTDKKVLFGHHFAAIAGAGPLVGPVLAAQMGYLPGMIGSSQVLCWQVRCRTLWCCSSLPAATGVRWVNW